MRWASRIRPRLLILFFRLAMVLSLAGYSTHAVEAAMHPAASPAVSVLAQKHHGHDQLTTADAAAPGHAHDHTGPGPEQTKASCCIDFCGVAGLTCNPTQLDHPRSAPILVRLDDSDHAGQLPPLHRPPNIREI